MNKHKYSPQFLFSFYSIEFYSKNSSSTKSECWIFKLTDPKRLILREIMSEQIKALK